MSGDLTQNSTPHSLYPIPHISNASLSLTNNIAASTGDATIKLLGHRAIHELTRQFHIQPTKKRGQNFMCDPGTVRKIVSLAHLKPSDSVLEIGPGLGSLTLGLLEAQTRVCAVELDTTLAQALAYVLESYAPHSTYCILNQDALTLTSKDIEDTRIFNPFHPFHLVANLPYNVAVPIFLTLLDRFSALDSAVILVQAEIADRLCASPGSKNYGAPSAKLAWYGTASIVSTVGRSVFFPIPNVDSSLVRFNRQNTHLENRELQKLTFSLIEKAFLQRRKMLRAVLKNVVSPQEFEESHIDPMSRGETLSIDDFTRLARTVLRRHI